MGGVSGLRVRDGLEGIIHNKMCLPHSHCAAKTFLGVHSSIRTRPPLFQGVAIGTGDFPICID